MTNMRTWYPELRAYLNGAYDAEELAARTTELLAYACHEPIEINHGHNAWVIVPATTYDALVSSFAACNNLIEARRQAVEPLPPIA